MKAIVIFAATFVDKTVDFDVIIVVVCPFVIFSKYRKSGIGVKPSVDFLTKIHYSQF